MNQDGQDSPKEPPLQPVTSEAGSLLVSHEERPARRSYAAPAWISLDRIDEDDAFRICSEGELSPLATDIARLGQLFPIELRLRRPDRFQIICGFRRVAALRFLKRDKVLARLHT